ncbi:hypothetical protein [Thalassobius sp. I31.1]|uniref:hypothetical protein n=1 Tax=Thalassobius sp. I31.1 TaxID=2109912 RepID=UPI0013002691|nr:hypothetical protein [Thalassobius sp. I31.1]
MKFILLSLLVIPVFPVIKVPFVISRYYQSDRSPACSLLRQVRSVQTIRRRNASVLPKITDICGKPHSKRNKLTGQAAVAI